MLLRSLRLQHKDSVTSLGVGMTNSLAELLTIMSKDAEFSDLFLRGVESDGTLNKIETHRYSLQCIYERVFLADSGDMGI